MDVFFDKFTAQTIQAHLELRRIQQAALAAVLESSVATSIEKAAALRRLGVLRSEMRRLKQVESERLSGYHFTKPIGGPHNSIR
jgi:hypothetical protein